MMSTNKSSGDRSDVPDLLKSLADYPFSFPDFEDTGKFFLLVVNVLLEQFTLLIRNVRSHGIIKLFSHKFRNSI